MQFLKKNWDLDFRAELYKQEFYGTAAWTGTRDHLVTPWEKSEVKRELDDLLGIKMKERPAHLGRIIAEQQGLVMIGYWYELLVFSPATAPLTIELVDACFHLAGSVAMFFKDKFNRVRPWVLEPELSPPIGLPGHPAFPSGHSTQMHLMALTLAYLVPEAKDDLMRIALDVAVNRERAGLHYPSDTKAGGELAGQIFGILTRECPLFQSTLLAAKGQEWPRGKWQGQRPTLIGGAPKRGLTSAPDWQVKVFDR